MSVWLTIIIGAVVVWAFLAALIVMFMMGASRARRAERAHERRIAQSTPHARATAEADDAA